MERNREGRRAGTLTVGGLSSSATRRPRIKDVSDDDDRLEDIAETRTWERTKKDIISSFHVSGPSNYRHKRKRPGFPQDSHPSGGGGCCGGSAEDADESTEDTEPAASEDEDEPPPPPVPRKLGKSRAHVKEDEFIMDIPSVPRKARSSISSSSRFSSISRRHQESPLPDITRHKSPVTSQIHSSSLNSLQKSGKRHKPSGAKLPATKAPKVSDLSSISDQEAEVAEALFVLARGLPSRGGILDSKFEARVDKEARSASPSTSFPSSSAAPYISGPTSGSLLTPGNSGNDYISSQTKATAGPIAEAPKRKRPRPAVKQEEGKMSMPARVASASTTASSRSPSVAEPDFAMEKTSTPTDALGESPLEKAVADGSPSLSSLHNNDELISERLDQTDIEQSKANEFYGETLCNVEIEEHKSIHSETVVRSQTPVIEKDGITNEAPPTSSRLVDVVDGDALKLNIDLMVPSIKLSSSFEEIPLLPTETQSLVKTEVSFKQETFDDAKTKELAKDTIAVEGVVKALDSHKELLKQNLMASGVKQIVEQEANTLDCCQRSDQIDSEGAKELKEEDREKGSEPAKLPSKPPKDEADNTTASSVVSSVLSTTAGSNGPPVALAGWMGGLPHMGYYGSGVPPWAVGTSLTSPSLDVKPSHPAVQLPHAVILPPVPRMKRCATHVYVAHFIYREQQLARHSVWSAALCRATPYNLNIPPVNMLDNENTRKGPVQQSLPPYGYTISQSGGPAPATSTALGSATSNHSAASGSMETGTAAPGNVMSAHAATSGNSMNAHAQYLQAMMQQNGFPSFPFTFNGPGQAAQFFNGPFFPPQLMPPLPHLQPLGQQTVTLPPLQKQQGMASLGHSLPSVQQQQLQLLLTPQSPSRSQQPLNNQMSTTAHFGDKESNISYSEGLPTVEQRLPAVPKSIGGQVSSNLPNLNVTPTSLMLGGSVPVMSSQDLEVSLMNMPAANQGGKTSHNASSLPSSVQQKQLLPQTVIPGPVLQMKVHDQPLPQGYSSATVSGANRGPVSSGPLGLVSMNPMVTTQGHGVLIGSTENSRFHVQQQGYSGLNQQYQRTVAKSASGSEDSYTAKGHSGDKKISMKQPGTPLLSRVDMEPSSPSLQGSPSSVGVSTTRGTSNVSRNPTSATSPASQSSRTTLANLGAGQGPLLPNQPSKQAVNRSKTMPVPNVPPTATINTLPAYVERALPGSLNKFQGAVLPFSGQTVNSSQGSKAASAATGKVTQRMSGGQTQPQVMSSAAPKIQLSQTRASQPVVPSTPPRVMTSGPMLPSGSLSMSIPHSPSVSKAVVNSASRSPSNGKGNPALTKPNPPAKRPPTSGATVASVNSGQVMSTKAPMQQKNQPTSNVSQFSQPVQVQQQRVGTKSQAYPQLQQQQGQYKQSFQQHQSSQRPQVFLHQQQSQYLQQQQSVSQHITQSPLSHHYQQSPQNSPTQLSHLQQHLRHDQQISHVQQQSQTGTSPTPSATSKGLSLSSPNLMFGNAIPGNINSDASDQFRGSGSRTSYSSGNPLAGGLPDMMTKSPIVGPGQISSSQSGSSNYLPLPSAKVSENKVSFDAANCDELSNARHLPSSSPSQPVPNSAST